MTYLNRDEIFSGSVTLSVEDISPYEIDTK